jgi:hypothetical protein
VIPRGWRRTTASFVEATVEAGQVTKADRIAETQLALVKGSVFGDINSNGLRDIGELGVARWVIYLDLNHDGHHQVSEPSVLSDESGDWQFDLVQPGTYDIRAAAASGWSLTTPTDGRFRVHVVHGSVRTQRVFGEHMAM